MAIHNFLVSFPLLCQSIMTKTTYRRQHLIGVHSSRGLESVTIMAGSMAAGKHGAGAIVESLHLIYRHKAKRKLTGNGF